MSYSSLISASKEKVYHHAIATKILDLMDNLRMDEKDKSRRRWIWELLQNAKDVQYDEKAVKIIVNFSEDEDAGILEFQHNGKPFTIDNITFLIEQVSTKERKTLTGAKPKTTGKFGTGFLTTHLLSEIVKINGFVKEPNLPYKYFELELDRSGETIEEIRDSIAISTEVLSEIEQAAPTSNYNPESFNTHFKYSLDSDGIEVAKEGMKDLENGLAMTLAFVKDIRSVEVTNTGFTYTLLDNPEELSPEIQVVTIGKSDFIEDKNINFVIVSGEKSTIAIPVNIEDGQYTIEKINENIPKLFCDFPLIGTEDIILPFVLNSSHFNPNEPRNGVFLSDKSNEKIEENKAIFIEALTLYGQLLDYACENSWEGIHELARINEPSERRWLSNTWYKENVVDNVHDLFGHAEAVLTAKNSRRSILNEENAGITWFPYASTKEIREKIWTLGHGWIPSIIPAKSDIHLWYDVVWQQCPKLTVKEITSDLHSFENLEKLGDQLAIDQTIKWLNGYYELLNLEGKVINEVIAGKYAVIPNQNDEFRKMTELYFDQNIEDQLKDILLTLGEDVRDELRRNDIETQNKKDKDAENQITHNSKKSDYVVSRINSLISKADADDEVIDTCLELISLINKDADVPGRTEILAFAKKIFQSFEFTPSNISYNDKNVWMEADKVVIRKIVLCISECDNLERFAEEYNFKSTRIALEWLNDFITYLISTNNEQYINQHATPILPNQNGDFVVKDVLFLDDDSIGEDLKDIALSLGNDIREELLDTAIYLELPENRTVNEKIIADKITALIVPLLSELPRSESTKETFKLTYIWFNKNKTKSETIFKDLYTNRHKLYDDDEVAENMLKAENLKQLMDEYDISDLDQLRDIISSKSYNSEPKTGAAPITKETLASLGIGSLPELEIALKDVNLAKVFLHNSIPTIEMFGYAQKLIARAMRNILEHLEDLEEYECEDAEQIAPTVFGGIKYNGYEINIVARPADNREVIIYYSSEKDVLELPESQLWVDDGQNVPQLLTLGKILKVTGITKIPYHHHL